MQWGWVAGVLILAAMDWLAVGFNQVRWRVVTKPAPMVLLIAGFTLFSGWQGAGVWFGFGLVASLAGDIFLMLRPSLFPAGLTAFLLAHLFYIVGFNQSFFLPGWNFIFPLLGLILLDSLGYRRLRRAVMARPSGRWIRFPMLGYVGVISLMLFSSLLTWLRPDWSYETAALVSVGALLFYISDTVLAFNRFCGAVPFGRVIVIATYHLAQLAITAGVLAYLAQS